MPFRRFGATTERYVQDGDLYVLFAGRVRLFSTRVVAVLIDTRLGVLVTHGAPACVRHELDEMRKALPPSCALRYEADWLLLEGRPHVEVLNAVLRGTGSVEELADAFRGNAMQEARRVADALIARISQRQS